MGVVNQQVLDDLNRMFIVGFNEAFEAAVDLSDQIATRIPVTGSSASLKGLKAFAKQREWVGPRQHKSLTALALTVEPRKYEDTVDVGRDDIEDDTENQFMPAIQGMADGGKALNPDLVAQVLQGTHSQLGYDGLVLGSATHAMGGTTYNNLTTNTLTLANLKTAIDFFGLLKDEAGKNISIKPTHIITRNAGTSYWAAKALMESDNLEISTVATQNPVKGELIRKKPEIEIGVPG